jgi:hypothetical protein
MQCFFIFVLYNLSQANSFLQMSVTPLLKRTYFSFLNNKFP